MPVFSINDKDLNLVKSSNFTLEKELQTLVEKNLDTIFSCRFVASEFSTGAEHAGRIDTLALSEENNPVIIEYKKVESSDLVNQSLFYLSWLQDHKGDFQVAATKALGEVDIDWSDIRVICIAPGFKKYDLHAVKMMGANIELWKYRRFENNTLFLDEVFNRSSVKTISTIVPDKIKDPKMVEAGKKAAHTRATGVYTVEEHFENIDQSIFNMATEIQEYILQLDDSVEEVPKKNYLAYKLNKNFVCMEIQKKKILLFLKLDPTDPETPLPKNGRDMRNKGHFGTGDFELTIANLENVEEAKPFIQKSFERVGG